MNQLQFKIVSSAIEEMFRGGMEDIFFQKELRALVLEGVCVLQENLSCEVVASVHDVQIGGRVVADVKARIWADSAFNGREDVEGRLI